MAEPQRIARAKTLSKTAAAHSSSKAAELLFEIGVEELPYQFIPPALLSLKNSAEQLLNEHRLTYLRVGTIGTPRRLVLVVEGLSSRQTAAVSEIMGPSKAVAFDPAGQPTKAAVGFATGQGIAVADLQVRHTPKGEYVFAVKQEDARPTKALLLDLIPALVSKLTFPKAMVWNEAGIRFARPVRWLVALFAGKLIPVEIAGIKAGNKTYGHRVLGGGKQITVRDYKTYVQALERHGVLPDPDRRRTVVREQLDHLCKEAGVGLNDDDDLLEQAVFTTEWPIAVLGSFKPEYLTVPSEILITSMKEHQGFFSVRDQNSGALAAHFVAVTNNKPKHMGLIREGNERVLAARLADAKFFFDEDRKTRLEERVKKLAGVTFHQKLGTMAQKQERIKKLAGVIASHLAPGNHELKRVCERAGELCKADLVTGIVGEFPELQGIMGGEYAKHDGESKLVGLAIREQYLPRGMEGKVPETVEGKILSLADRLDTIAAFFRAGMNPRGSEDPYALRRHALSIIRIIVEANLKVDLAEAVHESETIAERDVQENSSMLDSPLNFIFERFRFYAGTLHVQRDDVMAAVCETAYGRRPLELVNILEQMKALQAVAAKPDFDPLIIGFKRAHRIVEKEQWDRKPVDPSVFKEAAETELHRTTERCKKEFDRCMADGHYQKALDSLVALKPAIDDFFTAVMVNADDPAVRRNRLSLLKEVDELFVSFADFSKIVVQGN